jgi:hypothetical protein
LWQRPRLLVRRKGFVFLLNSFSLTFVFLWVCFIEEGSSSAPAPPAMALDASAETTESSKGEKKKKKKKQKDVRIGWFLYICMYPLGSNWFSLLQANGKEKQAESVIDTAAPRTCFPYVIAVQKTHWYM